MAFLSRQMDQIYSSISEKTSLSVVESPYDIISQCLPTKNKSHLFWWQTTGSALSILLDRAGGSRDSNIRSLLIYYLYIIPYLGEPPKATANQKSEPQWKSFMTDDHTPVELSWSWGNGREAPIIRFSFEPIGTYAGTEIDPLNAYSAFICMDELRKLLPYLDLRWFDHFSDSLLSYSNIRVKSEERPGGNKSRVFLAFDLLEDEMIPKAYFFPGFKAVETGREGMDVISDAIETLPDHTTSTFPGFKTLHAFTKKSQLEVEMLAIDCVEPAAARLKIYVRNRSTSWNSIRQVVNLGGTPNDPGARKALDELKLLWTILFNLGDELSPDQELAHKNHRTAGILFNFELRPGSTIIVPKVYIPVRHYMKSDREIMQRLNIYLHTRQWGSAVEQYSQAMKQIFGPRSLRRECGAQTYLGVTLKNGGLSLISYVNPQVYGGDTSC